MRNCVVSWQQRCVESVLHRWSEAKPKRGLVGLSMWLRMVNFLFDSSQTPHIAASQIWEYFDLSSSTMQAKSKQIRDLMGMDPMDPDWSTPSMVDKNPLIWMLEVNGLIIDVRHAPKEIQEAAFRQGLIPYCRF